MPIKPSLSDWIQFLGIKATLKTSQHLGMASIFIVALIGIISIYYIIGNYILTIIGSSGLIILYIGTIKKFLNKVGDESIRAEKLLNKIMNEEIDDIDQIRKIWFKNKRI